MKIEKIREQISLGDPERNLELFNQALDTNSPISISGTGSLGEEINNMQNQVKIGDRIRIIEMDGEPQYTGKEGEVEFIDSIGQIH